MVEFQILGSLEAESRGVQVSFSGPCERGVLAALVLSAGRVVPVRQLVSAVWDDDPPATAGKQVKNAVSRLRRALDRVCAADVIVTEAGGYRLDADRCAIDAQAFEASVAAAELAASEGRTGEATGLLRSALTLWRGPALAGLSGRDIEWAAQAWDERRLAVQEMCCGYELALGRHREILGELASLAAGSPFREGLVGLYMLALYRCGRQADALAVYRGTRELLTDQLGLDPGPDLRGLQQQILTADPALTPAETTVGPALPQVRYSLPADTVAFTGRGGELSQIMAVGASAATVGAVVAVGAVDGMPGVGKTALAVHAAHVLAAQFPDRQLFIDLHAHTPGREPVRPEDALAGLLAAVGVDPRYLPDDVGGRVAMWRDRMAGQRAVLVLDNAASSIQVAPLLPGGGGCLVLVTSRRQLSDLPGAVAPVLVDVLPPAEAADMFSRLAPRAAADPDGVAQVVDMAQGLPLAVSLLARVFARHRSWTLADLITETQAGVLTLAAEHDSVAAAFEVSYRHLDPDARRLFRLLGVHPGIVIDAYAAAALARIGPSDAARLLDGLHREGLLTEAGYRRYGMHDLIRRYARELAAAGDSGGRYALSGLLDYYQHAAALAGSRLARQARPGPAPSVLAAFEVPEMEDADRALAWARADRANLLACLDLADRIGEHARVVALTAGLAAVLRHDGPWAQAITRHTVAVEAARHIGDRPGEANALHDLGIARHLTGDYPGAAVILEQALGIYRDLGSQIGEAGALNDLGVVRRLTGDYLGAAQVVEQSLGIFRDLGDRLGEAHALQDLGTVCYLTGDFPGAVTVLEQALAIYRDLGDRLSQAAALNNLGIMRYETGDFPGAVPILEQALETYRDLGDRLGQAAVLNNLATAQRLTGDYPGAARNLEQALGICRELGSRPGEAHALNGLGIVQRLTGDYPGATQILEQALGIYHEVGDQHGQAETLNEQGTLHRTLGELARAQECHQQALDVARVIGNVRDEAFALAGLGRCARAADHLTQAGILLRQAHQIFQRIGDAETGCILAELNTLARLESAP